MQCKSFNQATEFIRWVKITFVISLVFFLASIFGKESSQWITVLKISLGYGFSIFLMIWLSYFTVECFISRQKEKKGKVLEIGFSGRFLTSLVGLVIGAIMGQLLKSFITGGEVNYSYLPFLIVIGSFISLMFIYQNRSREQELENVELGIINKKLKDRREKSYMSSFTASLGNVQKVLQSSDILYFKSIDHYTHACTGEGEYIIDFSIKALSEKLDPSSFIQIHRNCIVAIEQIESIENGGQWLVRTRNGVELGVSRNSRRKLKEIFS